MFVSSNFIPFRCTTDDSKFCALTEPNAGPNYYGYVSSASIFTENPNILDRVITSENHPYWCLNWILDQKLDRQGGDDKQVTFENNHGTIRILLKQFGLSKSQVAPVAWACQLMGRICQFLVLCRRSEVIWNEWGIIA